VTKYPTIRNLMSQLTPIIGHEFFLIVTYSGAHDSGWFDDVIFRDAEGQAMSSSVPDNADRLVESLKLDLFRELGELLESRFPGWEIGDGHVIGSTGCFTLCSKDSSIVQKHEVQYEDSNDESPREVEYF